MSTENLLYGIRQEVWDKILAVLNSQPSIKEIILFGSRAKDNFKPGSDIDICLKGSELTSNVIIKLATELDGLDLPWLIDLIHYESIKDEAVKEHIDRVGIELGNW
jgi:predicted nucleotidyltransferase